MFYSETEGVLRSFYKLDKKNQSFPNTFYFSRGKKSIELLAEETLNSGEEFALIVSEMHGSPTEIKIIKVGKN